MKWIFTLLLSCMFFSASAQLGALEYRIGFDNTDSIVNLWYNHRDVDTNMKRWITIDTINYHHNLWQIGHPNKTVFTSAHSNPNAIITDSLNACTPNDTSVFIIKFPTRVWEGFNYFKFNYRLDIDTGDMAMVEISNDTGKTWRNLLTDTMHTFHFWKGKPDFSRSDTSWDTAYLFINNSFWYYPYDTLLARFTFITGDSTTPRDGWMLDDFVINYNGEGIEQLNANTPFHIYPNPANRTLVLQYNLPSAEDVIIKIGNVLGQIVFLKKLQHVASGNMEINTTNIPPGTYEVILQSGKETITRQLVIAH